MKTTLYLMVLTFSFSLFANQSFSKEAISEVVTLIYENITAESGGDPMKKIKKKDRKKRKENLKNEPKEFLKKIIENENSLEDFLKDKLEEDKKKEKEKEEEKDEDDHGNDILKEGDRPLVYDELIFLLEELLATLKNA